LGLNHIQLCHLILVKAPRYKASRHHAMLHLLCII